MQQLWVVFFIYETLCSTMPDDNWYIRAVHQEQALYLLGACCCFPMATLETYTCMHMYTCLSCVHVLAALTMFTCSKECRHMQLSILGLCIWMASVGVTQSIFRTTCNMLWMIYRYMHLQKLSEQTT